MPTSTFSGLVVVFSLPRVFFKTLFFRVTLGSWQNRWKAQRFFTHFLSPHMHSLPHYQHPHHSHSFVTFEPAPARCITQSPQFTLQLTLSVAHVMGLHTCIMALIHHYDITRSDFTAVQILCVPPTHPCPLSTTRGHHWSFYYVYNCAFSSMSYSWSHTLCSLYKPAFFQIVIYI